MENAFVRSIYLLTMTGKLWIISCHALLVTQCFTKHWKVEMNYYNFIIIIGNCPILVVNSDL